MTTKKYTFTGKTTSRSGHILHQIEAIRDFGGIRKGDIGGWIEYEGNLSHDGNCWVEDDAHVFGRAAIYNNALVQGKAEVFGRARVCENSLISGSACVYGDAYISGGAVVLGTAHIYDEAKITGYIKIMGSPIIRTTAHIQSQYDFLAIENLGSRADRTTFYKTAHGGIDVTCGCFTGSIKEFLNEVNRIHGANKHGMMYYHAIMYAKAVLM